MTCTTKLINTAARLELNGAWIDDIITCIMADLLYVVSSACQILHIFLRLMSEICYL